MPNQLQKIRTTEVINSAASLTTDIPRHPTTVCSVAAGLYMDWAATLKQLRDLLVEPDGEGQAAAKEARLAYEQHVKTCRICKEA